MSLHFNRPVGRRKYVGEIYRACLGMEAVGRCSSAKGKDVLEDL